MLYAIDDSNDEFLVEDTNSNIKYELESNSKLKKYQVHGANDDNDLDENRNYYGISLLEYQTSESKKYQNSISVQLVARSGYYSGANYDVNIVEYDLNGYECTINGEMDMTKKQRKELNIIFSEIEKTLQDYATKLVKLATFSNGEAVYKLADE